jgi:hypothetical protein
VIAGQPQYLLNDLSSENLCRQNPLGCENSKLNPCWKPQTRAKAVTGLKKTLE